MELQYLESVDSTHTYLKDLIKLNGYKSPICVYTNYQTNGIGSRGNSWIGVRGNLFFSFVLDKKLLPNDLQIQSASIYFSFVLKKVLEEFGSKLWLKWPNDFYIENSKIGGTITTMSKDLFFCGIGLNLISVTEDFKSLDVKIDSKNLLETYFENVTKQISWKVILKEYMVEFDKSRKLTTTVDNQKISLHNATLNDDGSININNKKVFSLR